MSRLRAIHSINECRPDFAEKIAKGNCDTVSTDAVTSGYQT
jgi:hypothetical protein